MINNLHKLRLSGLIGFAIGVFLMAYIEPETPAGAAVLFVIGVIPCLIIGGITQVWTKKYGNKEINDKKNDA